MHKPTEDQLAPGDAEWRERLKAVLIQKQENDQQIADLLRALRGELEPRKELRGVAQRPARETRWQNLAASASLRSTGEPWFFTKTQRPCCGRVRDPMRAPPEENPPGATGGLGILFPDRNDFLSTTAIAAAQAVIGIDAGIGGALALVSRAGDLIEVADMPILRAGSAGRASVNAPLLAELLARWRVQEAICEFVAARPGEGPTGAFSFGRCRKLERGAELHPALEKSADFIRAHGGDRLPEPRLVEEATPEAVATPARLCSPNPPPPSSPESRAAPGHARRQAPEAEEHKP
ncbi:MAG TPA: hypothetical protein VFE60_04360 [Roseiarcus sp.]|jgi:hypothetical protein|nr:hypothetical protein [Roseiarcus sp.]